MHTFYKMVTRKWVFIATKTTPLFSGNVPTLYTLMHLRVNCNRCLHWIKLIIHQPTKLLKKKTMCRSVFLTYTALHFKSQFNKNSSRVTFSFFCRQALMFAWFRATQIVFSVYHHATIWKSSYAFQCVKKNHENIFPKCTTELQNFFFCVQTRFFLCRMTTR